jgi:hypothetical protein
VYQHPAQVRDDREAQPKSVIGTQAGRSRLPVRLVMLPPASAPIAIVHSTNVAVPEARTDRSAVAASTQMVAPPAAAAAPASRRGNSVMTAIAATIIGASTMFRVDRSEFR